MNETVTIDDGLLDRIMREAEKTPRLRMNFNLHESHDSKAQRLVNVLLPGAPLPIHRHRLTAETYIYLRGKLYVVYYDDSGEITEKHLLSASEGQYAVHIPKGQWHGVEVLELSAVILVKDGRMNLFSLTT